MQAGFETLQQIEQALGDLSVQEQEMHRRLEVANSERSNLLEARLVAIKNLAQVRTKHALADNVINQADKLSVEVRDALRARQKTIAALEERHDCAEQARRTTIAHHEQVRRKIRALEDRLDELAVRAHASLANDRHFRAAQELLKSASETCAQAQKKA